MIGYQLRLAVRSLNGNRLNTVITIVGLAVAMGFSLLIATFVRFETGFDAMHPESDRVYRMNWESGGSRFATFFNAVPPQLAASLPEIERFSRLASRAETLTVDGIDQTLVTSLVDNDFFTLFGYETLAGDPDAAIRDLASVVVTEAAARRLFGTADALGRVVTVNDRTDFVVNGIVSNNPANSHLVQNIFINIENLETVWSRTGFWENLGSDVMYTYVRLAGDAQPGDVETKAETFYTGFSGGAEQSFVLQPLRDIHFTTDLQNEMSLLDEMLGITKSLRQRTDVLLFTAVALLTLTIASINFMNLQLVQFTRRVREVGIRRLVGASKSELVRQLMLESLLIAVLALGLALLLCELFMPWFNTMVSTGISTELVVAPASLWLAALATLAIGAGAGLYPALKVGSLSPVNALQGEIIRGVSSSRYRSGLIVVQFAISIGLIIAAGTVYTQIRYALEKSLGFDPDGVITVGMPAPVRAQFTTLRSELLALPGVTQVSAGSTLPTRDLSDGDMMIPEGASVDQMLQVRTAIVVDDYFAALGMDMVAGRALSEEFTTDYMGNYSFSNMHRNGAVVLNESAARRAGFDNPADAVGARFFNEGVFNGVEFSSNYTVVGVARDAHFGSIRQEIPSVSFLLGDTPDVLIVRMAAGNRAATLQAIDAVLARHYEDGAIQREFLADNYSAFYAGESRTFALFIVLSVIAVCIACLGLYAITTYIAERRIREISIRKVLGATVRNLVALLSWDFSKLVLVANVVAWPLAWLAMQNWLTNFAYRTDMSLAIFLLAGVLTFTIALVTTAQRAWLVAITNPVNALRSE